MSTNITSQTAVWLMYLGRTRYGVGPGGLTLNMVVEIVCESAASQGRQFVLDDPKSWMVRDPLGLAISVAALSGLRPCDATFCFRCVRTWRSTPLGDGLPLPYGGTGNNTLDAPSRTAQRSILEDIEKVQTRCM